MTALNSEDWHSPKHRIKVLKKTRQHTDEKIFALEAELARREGTIGVSASKALLEKIRAEGN
jgi:hypothetical protein